VHRSKQHRYDKRKFMERWPERKYQLASPPLTSCDGQICTLTGLVDWVATNSMTRSGGKAEVEYRVLWTEQSPQITHESGRVLERNQRQLKAAQPLQRPCGHGKIRGELPGDLPGREQGRMILYRSLALLAWAAIAAIVAAWKTLQRWRHRRAQAIADRE
jgi:hypothetical protein